MSISILLGSMVSRRLSGFVGYSSRPITINVCHTIWEICMSWREDKQQPNPITSALTGEEDHWMKRLEWIPMVGWTLVLILVLSWNWVQLTKNTQELARLSLQLSAERDLIFRHWATEHGGVYVPITGQTPPNPYLEHQEQNIMTPSGRHLTLLNPAYMMRQVYDMVLQEYGIYGRLTSLDPINPDNLADSWEEETLKRFSAYGTEELSAIIDMDGKPTLRLMQPFYTEDKCLTCHGMHGHQVGDLHGGISLSTSMEPYLARIRSEQLSLAAGYFLIWLIGLGGIGWATRRVDTSMRIRRESEERYRTIVENTNDALYIHDFQGNVFDLNENLCRMLGYRRDELLGANMAMFDSPKEMHFSNCMAQLVKDGSMVFESTHVRKDGSVVPVEVSMKLVSQDGNGIIQGFIRDITERKQAEGHIRYISFHDSLTGLYNRAYLEKEMQRLDTERQLPIGIIMADLNGLKLLNDTFGHEVGDEMLKHTAEILKNFCRSEDIIARWGGDEFVIFLPQTTEEDANTICKRINEKCKETSVKDIPLSLALGTAIKHSTNQELAEILKEADENMYKQKLAESQRIRSNVLKTLLKNLEAKSFETEAHYSGMQNVAQKIGKQIGLSESELNRLRMLLPLHDIGKINISEDILIKKDSLTAKEWAIIKRHPETGYRIARATEEFAQVAEDILAHHEHWDGNGYPHRLKGTAIPLLARITNIVDAYDVMASGRPYKESLSQKEIAAELKKCAGTQFDPELVDIFLSLLEENDNI